MVLCLVLGASTAAMAQEPVFGVKGGVNFANLNFDLETDEIKMDRRTGFVGGLFMIWPGNSRAALQVEALFSQKGSKLSEDGFSGKLKIDYLDVPVLVRLSSGSPNRTSFHVIGGPSVGFKLRARATDDLAEDGSSEDISDDVKSIDFGLVAGVGVDMGRITVDARQAWGLSNINDDPEDDEKVKTRTFSVMLGIRF